MSKRFQPAAAVRATPKAVALRAQHPNLHLRPRNGDAEPTAPLAACGVAIAALLPTEFTTQWPLVGCSACLAHMPRLIEVSDDPAAS